MTRGSGPTGGKINIKKPADELQTHEQDRRIASRVAGKYGLFECDACAADIIKALGRESDACAVRIRPADGTEFIGLAETNSPISYNRSHVGVQVGGRVFDNLHPEGVPTEEWPGRFFTQTGARLVKEVRPVGDFFGARFRRQQFRDWVYED
jgi:hypothetical protein